MRVVNITPSWLLQYKGFISGALLTSLVWTVGLLYITYTSGHLNNDHIVMRSVPPSDEVERWATNMRHSRVQHGIDKKEILYKKMRQMKRATTAREPHQQNKQLFSQNSSQRQAVDDMLSEKIQAIKSNRIDFSSETTSETTVQQEQTSRQLFISDKPTVVKTLMSWKEAGKTNTFEEEEENKDGFARHAFNQYASDRLGYFREIPDARHSL